MKNKGIFVSAGGVALILGAIVVVRLGLVPVNADASPSSFEMRLLPIILHASVARAAKRIHSRPVLDDPQTGGEIYASLCAECHGRLGGKAGLLGLSMYPPATQLPGGPDSYSSPELFWVIKHGIRNTGMPAWGGRLADQDIWNLVSFLRTLPERDPAITR